MMRKENFLSGIIVFFSAAILSAFTAVSLIFFEVADYVYLNIAGLFIFCMYFGFVPSVFYLVAIACIMIKFRLADTFFSYSLVLGFVNAAIISLFCAGKIKFKKILAASAVMALFSRIIASELYSLLSSGKLSDVTFALSFEKIIAQARIYLFSGACTIMYFYIFKKIVQILKKKQIVSKE